MMQDVVVTDEIQRLAQESPDNESGGYYTRDNKPYCIMALMLINVGLSDLEELNEYGAGKFIASILISKGFTEFKTLNFAANVQVKIDSGSTWGSAVETSLSLLTS